MKRLVKTVLAICLYGMVTAQNTTDIVYLNNPVTLGTPRFVATAGAFTALGNDLSGIHVNPAGLAVFRHDEMGFTLGWSGRSASSTYYGIEQTGENNGFLFTNIGYVKRFLTKDPDVTWNIGITYNRNADLNSKTQNLGENPTSSILNEWMNNATGSSGSDLFDNGLVYESLAWHTFLIDDHPDLSYSTEAEISETSQFWEEEVSGRFDELSLTFALADEDKWYYGISLNVPFYKYGNRYYYTEAGFQGDSIKGLEWFEEFSNRGAGFNFKLGGIYRPTQSFRIGASIWSPTWLSINQTYYTEINARYWNSDDYSWAYDPQGSFDYNMRTAPQTNVGFAWVFNKSGFISIDYGFIATKWSGSSTSDLNYLKNDIKEDLAHQHNVRVGTEIRIVNFFVRGGFSWLSNPYSIENQDATRKTYTLGIGYRTNKFNADLSFGFQNRNFNYYPYNRELTEPANQAYSQRPLLASVSFRL